MTLIHGTSDLQNSSEGSLEELTEKAFTVQGVVLGPALSVITAGWRYGPEQGRTPVYYLGGPQEATPKPQQPQVLPTSNRKMHTLTMAAPRYSWTADLPSAALGLMWAWTCPLQRGKVM